MYFFSLVTFIRPKFSLVQSLPSHHAGFVCIKDICVLGCEFYHVICWFSIFFNYRDDTFADVHNLDQCIDFLNQSLETCGFPSSLDLNSNDPVSISTDPEIHSSHFFNTRDLQRQTPLNILKRKSLVCSFCIIIIHVIALTRGAIMFYRLQSLGHAIACTLWFSSGNGTSSIVSQSMRKRRGETKHSRSWF